MRDLFLPLIARVTHRCREVAICVCLPSWSSTIFSQLLKRTQFWNDIDELVVSIWGPNTVGVLCPHTRKQPKHAQKKWTGDFINVGRDYKIWETGNAIKGLI